MSSDSTALAQAPFSLSPSWSFDGDDGSWSTFSVSIGTPPQSFRILPSTTGAETWVPISMGCEGVLSKIANCGTLRGVNNFHGAASRGFETNASSTWDLIGTYELATEQNLWGSSGNQGLYGLDTVLLERYGVGHNAKLTSQTVAGVATPNVWLGSLGLGTASAGFSIETENTPSLLVSMKNGNITPSLSYGYTAGASYTKTPGSLTIGGYDQARFTPSNLSFPIGGYNNQNLPLSIKSIVAENTLTGILSMLPSGKAINIIIDSTVSQMWLPQSVCNRFAKAFGLQYDSATGLYLVNTTMRNQLEQLNPSVTFTIGGQDSSSPNTNIVLPYAAFNLQGGIPLFNSSTHYFPLRVAANESQQVLGRVFLQEAYVFVDWERKNFTIGRAIHQNKTTDIVKVLPPPFEANSSGLSTSVIVGIAVGACGIIALAIGLATFLIVRARRRRSGKPCVKNAAELQGTVVEVQEMDEGLAKHELVGTQISELQAESFERELEGDGERMGKLKEKWHVYELP